jgi:uncharacterized tellurite resistance protein B-like protein
MRLTRFLTTLGLHGDGAPADADAAFMRRLQAQLVRLGPARMEYLAGFAGQLARVAHVEDGVSAAEALLIKTQLTEHGLTGAEAGVVLDLLRHEIEVLHSLQHHVLNRAVNKHASAAEKEALVDCLYAVAAADHTVSDVEEREIRRVADALLIPHSVLMRIRGRYRDRIEVLVAMKRVRR